MVVPILAMLVATPMQLAAAAGIELAGGYDSTVLNQQTLAFGDGALGRGAVDLQIGHRTEHVRQLLRTRGEYYFTDGEGKSLDQGDFTSFTRYALHIEPSDEWEIEGNASYTVGQAAYLLGLGASPDLYFQRGLFGEYNGAVQVHHDFSDTWRGTVMGGVMGRHAIELPPGLARENMLTFLGVLEAAHDFSEANIGLAAGRLEYFLIDGYFNWVARVTGYVGWRHNFGENSTLTLLGGADALEDQNDPSQFFVGPYGNVTFATAVPEDHFAFGIGACSEYAVVSTTRCGVPVMGGGACPQSQVLAGGTGRVWGAMLAGVWRPGGGKFSMSGDVVVDYGTTSNADDSPGAAPGAVHDVAQINISALANFRWIFNPNVSVFARYNFLYSDIDAVIPGSITQLVRHVAMAGVTFALGTEDDGVTEPLIPFAELAAMQGAHGFGGGASGGGDRNGGGSHGATPDAASSDPFDLSQDDAPAADDPGAGLRPEGETTDAEGDSTGAPPPAPRYATQPATQPGTARSTSQVNHGTQPVATPPAPPADATGGAGTPNQGTSTP